MWKLWTFFVCTVLALSVLPEFLFCKDLQIQCDIDDRNSSCPSGYCCVRDDFLFTETYCKQLGSAGSSCITKESHFECHCHEGYFCASNIHGLHSSVFGKCRSVSGGVTNGIPFVAMTTDTSMDITTDGGPPESATTDQSAAAFVG